MISFDPEVCKDFAAASSREWLETNGIGGFASGTISGANTRRYHGILTAATKPPLGRITMVSKLEETVTIDGGASFFDLSSNQYPASVHPRGFEFLRSFRLDPFPIWTYALGDVEIEKRVFMVHGSNATVVTYNARSKKLSAQIEMKLRPLLSFVNYHHLQHETEFFDGLITQTGALIEMRPSPDLPPVYFTHNGLEAAKSGYWYRDFEYAIEQERGFDFREDLYQPFEITFDLSRPASLISSADMAVDVALAADLERSEIKRRNSLVKTSEARSDLENQLVLAADQFIVKRGEGHSVIAGYPWFSDWGRDTMIALPGLTLSTGRPEIARGILLQFARSVSQGMIPNRFPDEGETADYNTVDATLWYFEAIRAYVEKTGDDDFVKDELYGTLTDIIEWHLRGTRYNIHVDTDGLVHAGEPSLQLTWMDAKIGDLVITPRIGKAVEIQALWYNALMTMADLSDGEEAEAKYLSMAELAKLSFNAVFWNDAEHCLYDVVENGNRDGSIRPNQIFAASLHYSMLDAEKAKMVVDKVETELLTPVGLRSLSPNDPRYVDKYIGSPFNRDSAYHQGTVWVWLIGPFVDAYRRVYPKQADQFLDGFRHHLFEAGLGQISEIFDANPPHSPRGCPAQAWSVAEVLRVLGTAQ